LLRSKANFGILEGFLSELLKRRHHYKKDSLESLYPEYYLIKINRFNDIAKDTLDEWIFF